MTKKKQRLVDPKSYEIAKYFLDDFTGVTEDLILNVAEAVQYEIECMIGAAEEAGLIKEAPDPDYLREIREENLAILKEYPDDD